MLLQINQLPSYPGLRCRAGWGRPASPGVEFCVCITLPMHSGRSRVEECSDGSAYGNAPVNSALLGYCGWPREMSRSPFRPPVETSHCVQGRDLTRRAGVSLIVIVFLFPSSPPPDKPPHGVGPAVLVSAQFCHWTGLFGPPTSPRRATPPVPNCGILVCITPIHNGAEGALVVDAGNATPAWDYCGKLR